jgi:hypothetical protein
MPDHQLGGSARTMDCAMDARDRRRLKKTEKKRIQDSFIKKFIHVFDYGESIYF